MKKIRILLRETVTILAAHGAEQWNVVLADLQERFEKANASGNVSLMAAALEDLKELFGGMGSFNDVFISPEAGHHISRTEVNRVNERFQHLLAILYQIVTGEIDRIRRS